MVVPARRLVIDGGGMEVRADAAAAGAEHRPPLVFLHEGPRFDRPVAHVSRRRPGRRRSPATVVYSRHGYGPSAVVDEPRPVDYMHHEADVVLPELLDELGIERPVLIGHSDGASIALLYAGAGRTVAGLVLLAPHVFVEDRSIAGIAAARVAFARSTSPPGWLATTTTPSRRSRGWNDVWLSPGVPVVEHRGPAAAIDCPVLLVQGADDQYGSLAQLDAIERGVTGRGRRLVVPGVGHSPHLEAPEATRGCRGVPRPRHRGCDTVRRSPSTRALHRCGTGGSPAPVTPRTYDEA